jgi:hypothetical protein
MTKPDPKTDPKPRELVYQPLDSLVPDERNPKLHDLIQLTSSMKRFGVSQGVANVDERTGKMYAGHGRREALLQLRAQGEEPPDGVIVREADGEWLVPVGRGWSSKNDEEALAYLITDNESTIGPGWDNELLLPALESLDADLQNIAGWDDDRLKSLQSEVRDQHDDYRADRNPRMDEPNRVECPSCGNVFVPVVVKPRQ